MTTPPHSLNLFEWLGLLGIWFTALVALFLPLLYRPRLRVVAKSDGIGSSTYLAGVDNAEINEELWLKVGVYNTSTINAQDVEVRLIFTRERNRADRGAYRVFSSWWLKVSALPQTKIGIPPKYTQYVDLCYLQVKGGGSQASMFLAAVRPPVRDWELEKRSIESDPKLRLEPFIEYDVVFAVSGHNTRASYWRVTVKWNRPMDRNKALRGEAALRGAVVFGRPAKVGRLIELEDPSALANALER